MKRRLEKFIKNPKKALITLSIPIALGMMVQALYNVVDTAFVGRLGSDAIAALTFSFPLFFILIALNAGMSSGMGSRISRYLGEKNKPAAENTAMHGIILSSILAVIVFIIGNLSLSYLLKLFGAEGHVFELASTFMHIIFFGFLLMFPAFALSGIFSSQGDTKTPMRIQVGSLILNIILDPILIYWMGLGVRGAAIATTISFGASLLAFIYFINKKSHLKLKWKNFKFSKTITKDIIHVGAPATLMMLLLSIYMIFLNRFMMHFGVDYVAAYGIVSRLESLTVIPIVAFSMAIITLIGMFYGAKRYDLIKDLSWYGLKVLTLFTVSIGFVLAVAPKIFLRIFTSDAHLLELAAPYLRIDVITFPLMGLAMMVSRIMQGMGHGVPGLVINVVRVFGAAVPTAYLFVYVLGYGYLSVAWAMVIGGVAASILAIGWLEYYFRKFKM